MRGRSLGSNRVLVGAPKTEPVYNETAVSGTPRKLVLGADAFASTRRLLTGRTLCTISAMRRRLTTSCVTILLWVAASANSPASDVAGHPDRVLVLKSEHTLQLLTHGKVVKSYKVALGGDPGGPKTHRGDHKTPEGIYVLDFRNVHSQFHKAIHISYPNAHDRALARQRGVSPVGDVFVHGLPNGYGAIGAAHRLRDWTDGCIAVTDEEIDEIWAVVADGTPIEIRP
jgi:murein L,D-transpeptidase YafK